MPYAWENTNTSTSSNAEQNDNQSISTGVLTPTQSGTNLTPTTAVNENTQNDVIDSIIANMDLQEKIGQMFIVSFTGTNVSADLTTLVHDYHVGGVILFSENIQDDKQLLALLNGIKALNEGDKLPILISTDQEGGRISRLPSRATKFPSNLIIGKRNSATLSYQIGSILGTEMKAYGFNMDFAPVLDVVTNPQNTVIGDRSFGSNPDLVSTLGVATMKGISSSGVIPVVKHFPGHGDTSVDSHQELPVSNATLPHLHSFELLPFVKAIQNGASVVMMAHIKFPNVDPSGLPASLSEVFISDILRNELGFTGVVITDDLHMEAITKHYSVGDAAIKAVQAGADVVLVCHSLDEQEQAMNALVNAVKTGQISEERINESIKRIAMLKQHYDLTDEPSSIAAVLSEVGTEEHADVAKEASVAP